MIADGTALAKQDGVSTPQKKEYIRNVKKHNKGSNIANHARTNDHVIDFENGKVVDKGNFRIWKILESWHTAITNEADNISKPLPRQYAIILRKQKDANWLIHLENRTAYKYMCHIYIHYIILFAFTIYIGLLSTYLLPVEDYRLVVESLFMRAL